MGSTRKRTLAAASLLLVMVAGAEACDVNTDAGLYVPDAGTDGSPAHDATLPDAPVTDDGATDAATDADPGTDSGTDTGSDSGSDSGTDTGSDSGPDTGSDSGTDSGSDSGSDTGTDSGTDAGSDVDAASLCKTAFTVTAPGSGAYSIDGVDNPTLDVCKGTTVTFTLNAAGHPFWLKTIQGAGTTNPYTDGVTGNGNSTTDLVWVVSSAAPSLLYYDCEFHGAMTGIINVH
jgi:hypothetical protein